MVTSDIIYEMVISNCSLKYLYEQYNLYFPPKKTMHAIFQDGSQRGLILSSGKEWQEQRKFTIAQLRGLGFGRNSMESMMLYGWGFII